MRQIEVIAWRDRNQMASCITIKMPDETVVALDRDRYQKLNQILNQLQALFNEEEPDA